MAVVTLYAHQDTGRMAMHQQGSDTAYLLDWIDRVPLDQPLSIAAEAEYIASGAAFGGYEASERVPAATIDGAWMPLADYCPVLGIVRRTEGVSIRRFA